MAAVRGRADLQALKPRSRAAYERTLQAIALARRENLTIRTAARDTGVSVATVRKYAPQAVERDAFGRLVPTGADRLYRRMRVLTPERPKVVEVRGSRVASRIGEHWAAVGHYLVTGDEGPVRRFQGAAAGGESLATEPDLIDELGRRGEVSFEDLYEFAA